MAYDAMLGKLLLFSGVRGDTSSQSASTWIMQDSWTWDGTAWARLCPPSLPPGRSFGAMGYDAARRTTLLFGGGAANSDASRLDSWAFAAGSWSQLHPLTAPYSAGQMTYDVDSGSLLLYAGSTYAWDGGTWVDLHPAHGPSSGIPAFLTYDTARHAAVLASVDRASVKIITWTWSGGDWHEQHPAHQPSGGTATGAYDGKRGVVVALIDDQTWTWNGSDWSPQHPTRSPGARYFASAEYDPAVGTVMVFGGKSYGFVDGSYREVVNSELWSWDGTNWTKVA